MSLLWWKSNVLARWLTLTAIAVLGVEGRAATFTDDFDDNALNTSAWIASAFFGEGSVREVNQRLEITIPFAQQEAIVGASPKYLISGDFDATVEYALLSWPSGGGDYLGVSLDAWTEPGSVGVAVGRGLDGYFVDYHSGMQRAAVPTSDSQGRFRLKRTGNAYETYYWKSGGWELLERRRGLATAPVYIGVSVTAKGYQTSLAIDNLAVTATGFSLLQADALPHLAAGDTWTTELVVANASDQAKQYTFSFYDDRGTPLALPLSGVGNVTSFSGTVPAHGAVYHEATDATGPLRAGWGIFTAESAPTCISPEGSALPACGRVTVQAVFRSRVGTGLHYEAAVPSMTGGPGFVMPFDATAFRETGSPIYTGFAVVNLDSAGIAHITCTARDAEGGVIPDGISLPPLLPHGHYANYLFPNLTGKRGTLDCASDTPIAALGLRFIGNNAFTSISVYSK